MFLLDEVNDIGTTYNLPGIFTIKGEFNKYQFERTIKKLIERHEAFRTYFEVIDEEIVQKIKKDLEFEVEYKEVDIDEIESVIEEFIQPFDLRCAPLFRVALIMNKDEYILLTDMHHIIADGASLKILFDDFVNLYNENSLEKLRVQYKDFAVWQNAFLQSDEAKKQEEYWLKTFVGDIPTLDISLDFERPKVMSFSGDSIELVLDNITTGKVKKLANETSTTSHMLLFAVYNILLSNYSAQEDIIVGVPIEGRRHIDSQNIIGFFVNTLPIRCYPEYEKTFVSFLRDVKDTLVSAYENQDYQLDMILEKLKIERYPNRNPMFDTVFDMFRINSFEHKEENLIFEQYDIKTSNSKFDITFVVSELENNIKLSIEYNTNLFRREVIKRFIESFSNILNEVLKDPKIELGNIEVVSEEERMILYGFNKQQFNK